MFGVFARQFKKIDSYRGKIIFLLFVVALDASLNFGVLFTKSNQFLFAFILTEQVKKDAPLFYGMSIWFLKIFNIVGPFILAFFLLPVVLEGFLHLQKIEQKIVQKLIDRWFMYKFKKNRQDPTAPRFLIKATKHLASMNTWFTKRSVLCQYAIIIGIVFSENLLDIATFLKL
jgi:hypothetical protein